MKKTSSENMLQIGDALVSLDVLDVKFICNIPICHGACCVHGDSGAPLEDEEIVIVKNIFPKIKSYLQPEGIEAVEKLGTSLVDKEGDTVTPLINGKECAFTVFENGIAACGIEKAYTDGVIDFRKPLSCHLYPVRIKKYPTFQAVNYDKWDLCKSACALGEEKGIPLYVFLKEPLVRKFGKEWYEELALAAEVLKESDDSPLRP